MNPDYSGGPAAITVILIRGMQAGGVRIREHGNVKTEAEFGGIWPRAKEW